MGPAVGTGPGWERTDIGESVIEGVGWRGANRESWEACYGD